MATTTSPKRILFIGCGGITRAHRPPFKNEPDAFRVAGASDPFEDATKTFAADFDYDFPTFTDYEQALDQLQGQLDGALVTTPHHLHFPACKACLERGVPVLVEKPAVIRLDEIRQLQALEKPGVFVQAGQMQRFGQEENVIRDWILQSGEFGKARLINIDCYQNIEGYYMHKPDPWILDGELAGGGIVISVAVHPLDLLRYQIDQDFTEVLAYGSFDEPMINGAESTVAASFKMSGGAVGTLNATYTAKRTPYSQRVLYFGDNGTVYQHLDKPGGGYAGQFYISTAGGKKTPEWNDQYSGFKPVADLMPAGVSWGSAFVRQMEIFVQGIEEGKALANSLATNLNTIAVIDAIGRSLRSGTLEKVETV